MCIVGGSSQYVRHDANVSTRVTRIKNINNMILKVMDYKRSGINWKNEIDTVQIT